MIRLIASLAALAASLAGAGHAAAADFVARGNEPGWMLRLGEDSLTFQTMDSAEAAVSPVPAPEPVEGGRTYSAKLDGQPFSVTVLDRVCVDTMSGMPYPAEVGVSVGEQRFEGCGGDPEALLRGEWIVERITGTPVLEGSEVTLTVEEGGRMSGAASCNRWFGGFTLTGEGLSVQHPGASMMMCDDKLMEQEQRFLGTLVDVGRFEIGPDGALILLAPDGRAIEARRKG